MATALQRTQAPLGTTVTQAACHFLRDATPQDMGTGFVLLKPKDKGSDDGSKLEVPGEKGLTLSVCMRYLNLFTRATTLNNSCTINMSEGEPLMFHYPLSDETHGFLRFLLAPKMDH